MAAEEEETWKDIPGYEGYYQVSNFGRVKGLERFIQYSGKTKIIHERIIKQRFEPNRYAHLCLCKYGVNKYFNAHQLVGMAFLNHTPNWHELIINHIDGNGHNNNLSNLEIVTTRENHSTCFRKNSKNFASKYIGVTLDRRTKKWRASIRVNGARKHLGSFSLEVDAARAYQRELQLIKSNNIIC